MQAHQVALLDEDRGGLRRLDREQMLQSRQARGLVQAAQWHLAELQDEQLADQLRAWLAVKPRLM